MEKWNRKVAHWGWKNGDRENKEYIIIDTFTILSPYILLLMATAESAD